MPTSYLEKSAAVLSAVGAESCHGTEGVFPPEEMTEDQFNQFMLIENNEIPLSSVNFRKKLRTIVSVL